MPRTNPSPVLPHLLREEANAVHLYLQYKGYHWNVAGPLFRELHLMFDEHAEGVLGTIDTLAERQRILGARAPYSIGELRRASTLREDEELPSSPREMIERLLAAHRAIIEGMHHGFRAAEEAQDPGSADLFARFLQVHEKMEWFLRELASQSPPLFEAAARGLGPTPSATSVPSSLATFAPAPAPGRGTRSQPALPPTASRA